MVDSTIRDGLLILVLNAGHLSGCTVIELLPLNVATLDSSLVLLYYRPSAIGVVSALRCEEKHTRN